MTDPIDDETPDTVALRIRYVDLRGRTPVDLLRENQEVARTLVYNATNTFGWVSRTASKVLLPLADRQSRAWLVRTNNPYLGEIDAMAQILGIKGTHALNLSYEWGCTSGAFATGDSITLLRVLDWPFPELGKHVMVIHQDGAAGEFYNVGWPGLTGMLNGMAPGRFAATLNQAPMRVHNLKIAGDWAKNRYLVRNANGLPPTHLLRKVFEEAKDYAAAKEMLTNTPVALPVIYVLAGLRPGEGCIIERTETEARVIEMGTTDRATTSNHFVSDFANQGHGWRNRSDNSPERLACSKTIAVERLEEDDFDWVPEPIINVFSRLGVIANASTGRLLVQGLEGDEFLTQVFNLQEVLNEHQEPDEQE